MQISPEFLNIKLSNIIEMGILIVGILTIRSERQKSNQIQIEMHSENKNKLDQMIEFRDDQNKLNDRRDEQISSLASLSASMHAIAEGMNTRLTIIENIVHNRRSQ